MKMIGEMMTVSKGTFKIDELYFMGGNVDFVNVAIHFEGQENASGQVLNQKGLDLLKIKDGKIVEVWLFSSNQDQEDKYWGSK